MRGDEDRSREDLLFMTADSGVLHLAYGILSPGPRTGVGTEERAGTVVTRIGAETRLTARSSRSF